MAAEKEKKAGGGKKAASAVGRRTYYKIDSGKIVRQKDPCPKCGGGIFLAAHKDRKACGKCGYTEFQKK